MESEVGQLQNKLDERVGTHIQASAYAFRSKVVEVKQLVLRILNISLGYIINLGEFIDRVHKDACSMFIVGRKQQRTS